jgi:hypothetical protein
MFLHVSPLEHQCHPFSHGLMSCNVEGIKSYYRYRWLDHRGPTAVLHFEGQTVPHANIGQPPSALSLETAICICIVMASSLHLHLLNPLPNWKILRWGWDRFAVSWPVVALAMSWHVLGATEFCPNLCWYSARWCKPGPIGLISPLECFGMFWNRKVKESERGERACSFPTIGRGFESMVEGW